MSYLFTTMKRIFTSFVLVVALGFGAAAQDQGPVFSPASGSESGSDFTTTVAVEELQKESAVSIYSYNDQIFVRTDISGIVKGTAKVYDITGRLVISQELTNATVNTITSSELNMSYYIVAVQLNGKTYTSRVFVK